MSASPKPKNVHPTRLKLIETVLTLRHSQTYEDITVEQVLDVSGISRGSLYHHFSDFFDLIEAAEIVRFTKYVDVSIARISDAMAKAQTRAELSEGIREITRETQSVQMHSIRMDRIAALARAQGNPRFQKALGVEQDRLTQALADLVSQAQIKGFADPALDPHSVAVFIQAYTLGRAVDEISDSEKNHEAWNHLIDLVVDKVFMAPPSGSV